MSVLRDDFGLEEEQGLYIRPGIDIYLREKEPESEGTS